MAGAGLWRWRPLYRARQFWRASLADWRPLTGQELAEAEAVLPQGARPLFRAMPAADQRHSLAVLHDLVGPRPLAAPLAQAALLHDCAKHLGGIRLWHRVAAVLLALLLPGLWAGWGSSPPPARRDWRYPFWAHLHHPELGAGLAAAAGCEPDAVWLIAHHQERDPANGSLAAWLAALQAADDDN